MKKFIYGLLATAVVAAGAFAPSTAAKAASGEWVNGDGGWWYKYSDGSYAYSEWVDGCWLNSNGYWTYKNTASWKKDSTAWYYQDTSGWYPAGTYQWIDGTKYYFNGAGYLEETGWNWTTGGWYYLWADGKYAASEWIDGYWISADGYWTYANRAQWYTDSIGKYYMDSSGYYEKSTTVKIDGVLYTFDDRGYVVNEQPADNADQDANQDVAKEYQTEITPSADASVKVRFNGGSGKDFNDLLASYLASGDKKVVSINDKEYTFVNDNGTVKAEENGKSIEDVIGTGSSVVSFDISGLGDLTKAIGAGSGKGSYTSTIEVGGVAFSNISANGNKISFSIGSTKYDATINGASIVLDGDHTSDTWVKNLQDSKAATANKSEK